MTTLLSAESVLPAPLAERLRSGRETLLRQRTTQQHLVAKQERARAAATELHWSRLQAALPLGLPDFLLPYVEDGRPEDFTADSEAVAVAVRLPGLSPILALFRHAAGNWRRWTFTTAGQLDSWAVVLWEARDQPSEEHHYAISLPLALAMAEEAEHERQRLPASPFDDSTAP